MWADSKLGCVNDGSPGRVEARAAGPAAGGVTGRPAAKHGGADAAEAEGFCPPVSRESPPKRLGAQTSHTLKLLHR
eukprot:scaffold299560_cov55-Prasinocladus_malaysianus.AAC.1